ncbi:alpha/beta fold hydrolase [Streptomyces massasporeus]|uniref:Alpha/beta fold hydrolase n=1 Tax=Streptomyces massasporeus TaxID=67324 RepID=A0ABW6LNJ2_9ACTN
MRLFQLPGSGWMVTARDLALIDRLWRRWSPSLSLDPALQAELHEHLRESMPAPVKYYREMLRPGMLKAARRLTQPIQVPLLHLHGADDGCILPPQADDRHRFAATHASEVVPDVGHFLHIEAPRRSRNGSRHGPSSGSHDARGKPTGTGGAGPTGTYDG